VEDTAATAESGSSRNETFSVTFREKSGNKTIHIEPGRPEVDLTKTKI
jgi:hypothetical protein